MVAATYTLNLVAVEHSQCVNENPRQRATEVDQFMHGE